MAITLQDIIQGQQKIAQKDLMETTQLRMSVSELRQLSAEQLKPLEQTAEATQQSVKLDDSTAKGIDKLVDSSRKTTDQLKETVRLLKPEKIKELRGTVLGREQYKGVKERFSEGMEKTLSVRGIADMFNVIKRGSGGFFDRLLAKREERKEYITAREKMSGELVKTIGPRAARNKFEEEFKAQQEIQKLLRMNERQISRMEKLGFSQEQIAKTPEGMRQAELIEKMVQVDPRLEVSDEDREESVAREKEQTETIKEQNETLEKQLEGQEKSDKFISKIHDMMKEMLDLVRGGSMFGGGLGIPPVVPTKAGALGKVASMARAALPAVGLVGGVVGAAALAATPFLMDENAKGNPNETGDYTLSKPISEMSAYERFFGKVGAKRQSIEEMVDAGAKFTPEEAADIKKYYEIDVPTTDDTKQVTPTPEATPTVAPSVSLAPKVQAGEVIYNKSAENASVSANAPAVSNNVVAPTTINNKNERISIKNNTRNQDSSYSSLIQSRFVPV